MQICFAELYMYCMFLTLCNIVLLFIAVLIYVQIVRNFLESTVDLSKVIP